MELLSVELLGCFEENSPCFYKRHHFLIVNSIKSKVLSQNIVNCEEYIQRASFNFRIVSGVNNKQEK